MVRIYILWIVLWSIPSLSSSQSRYFVDGNAVGQNNGQSWADAFLDLHDALALALSGDEIWVAQGEYFPSGTADRLARFQLTSGAKLYGSFAGTEMLIEERKLDQNPSILSGDIGLAGDSLDNSYTILHLANPELGTWVDGFTFRYGQADNPALSNSQAGTSGAAIFIDGTNSIAYPNIQNCVFEHNTARSNGGAIYVEGSGTGSVAPTLKNCRFYQNRSFLGSGGGVYRNGGSWLERPKDIDHCQFIENRAARSGGGLYLNDAERGDTANIVGCQFQGNWAGICSDAIAWGYVRNTGSYIKIVKSSFTEHHHSGTLMMDVFGPDLATSEFYAVIDSSVFSNNSTTETSTRTMIGGLRFYSDNKWDIRNTYISENRGSFFLSDESNRGEPHNFYNIELQNNSWDALFTIASDIVCNKISIHDNTTGLFFTYLNVTPGVPYPYSIKLSNSEIYNNKLYSGFTDFRGTGLCSINSSTFSNNQIFNAIAAFEVSKFLISNSISFDNIYIGLGKQYPFLFDVLDSLYVSNSSLDTLPIPSLVHFYGPGSLFSTDPLFADYQAGDLNLLPCSPLINAGSNAAAVGLLTDLAGNPRIQGGTVDIGAYESPAFSLSAEPVVKPACVGESNGSISISPVYGCEPYIYNWSPQAGTGPELSGLLPGSYLLTLTDGSGRQLLDTVQVSTASLPELSTNSTDVDCTSGLGGSITALVSNGTAPYHYQWLPTAADTAYLTQLPPGNYSLTVTDINGCRDSASSNIALQGLLSLMVDGQIIRCFGETGWLSATPVTGLAPFSWAWTGWPGTDAVAEPLGPGNYSVTVTDTYGCTSSKTFPPMTEPGLLTIGTDSSDQTQTNPPNGAAVVTTISGGTGPFGYQWDMGSTEQAITGLLAGTYTVTVTDQNGCEAVAEVVVDLMVGTGEVAGEAMLIYPNPAVDWVQITCSEPVDGNWVTLSDASGRVLRSVALARGSEAVMLDLRGLPAGAYWVMVRNRAGQELYWGKVLKF